MSERRAVLEAILYVTEDPLTVEQLAKGLEKTAGFTGEILGLDCEAFLPRVAARREAILARGRDGMRPMLLDEVPKMSVRG